MAQLFEALRYKMEGREFDSRCDYWDISLTSSLALGSTSLRTSPVDKGGRYVGLTTLPPSSADCLKILETTTSWITTSPYSVPLPNQMVLKR